MEKKPIKQLSSKKCNEYKIILFKFPSNEELQTESYYSVTIIGSPKEQNNYQEELEKTDIFSYDNKRMHDHFKDFKYATIHYCENPQEESRKFYSNIEEIINSLKVI